MILTYPLCMYFYIIYFYMASLNIFMTSSLYNFLKLPRGPLSVHISAINSSLSSGIPSSSRVTGNPIELKNSSVLLIPSRASPSRSKKSASTSQTLTAYWANGLDFPYTYFIQAGVHCQPGSMGNIIETAQFILNIVEAQSCTRPVPSKSPGCQPMIWALAP